LLHSLRLYQATEKTTGFKTKIVYGIYNIQGYRKKQQQEDNENVKCCLEMSVVKFSKFNFHHPYEFPLLIVLEYVTHGFLLHLTSTKL
jgi:hypothetical protein